MNKTNAPQKRKTFLNYVYAVLIGVLVVACAVTIALINSKETSLDDSKLRRFKKNLAKLDQYQREVMPTEGIVFLYKGKVFKMTATFGAINQILGILKY
mgnify:CR=1 FL=1